MARVTIKVEGIKDLKKFLQIKGDKVMAAGEAVIKDHLNKQLSLAKANIHNVSGETASSLSAKIDGKSQSYVVGKVGAFNSAEDAIRANSLEFGHAAPNKAGGVKLTPAHPFLRPAIDSDKKLFKKDFKAAIKKVIEE
jgi:6-phosphogluconate dehydrogenase (decarboxylating)